VAIKITIVSPFNTIIITDNEELLSLELGSLRPRRAPRRDYSYRDFKSIIVELVANKTDITLLRKRKRTETKELSILVLVPYKTLFILN
jgi:hypothetical protein